MLETQGTSPETMIQTCWNLPGPDADLQSIPYKTFKKNGQTYSILLDIYIPSSFVPSIYPTAVVVHGGGWVGGCRRWNNYLSRQMADDGFVVFNIDYRLACDPAQNPGVYLCGFHSHWPAANPKWCIPACQRPFPAGRPERA